ncbi:hypothetical protein HKW90_01265 [Pseudomonas aeruginosa]|uniref:hypothetical protein n=1 Tax=Pseudomonas nitroreducens TaxID=46680 RepID=UPI00351D53EA|nr:hypothetical protein [Pseudomonas aeruginosa]
MHDSHFDDLLLQVEHYSRYPNLLPWVGTGYCASPLKLLILGESHYLPEEVTYHRDPEAWYAGVDLPADNSVAWMRTRGVVAKGLETNWKGKSKTIFRRLSVSLAEAGLSNGAAPFTSLAYMNYFQRPAEVTGKSIRVSDLDRMVSAQVLEEVAQVLQPHAILFCSKLAWNAAASQELIPSLRAADRVVDHTPHPASPWWYRTARKLQGRSGRDVFLEILREASQQG